MLNFCGTSESMYPYITRIEVHLSSEPVLENVDTLFIADGQVLEKKSLRNGHGSQWQWVHDPRQIFATTANAVGNATPTEQQGSQIAVAERSDTTESDNFLPGHTSSISRASNYSITRDTTRPNSPTHTNQLNSAESCSPRSASLLASVPGSDSLQSSPMSDFSGHVTDPPKLNITQNHFKRKDSFILDPPLPTSHSIPPIFSTLASETPTPGFCNSSEFVLSDTFQQPSLLWDKTLTNFISPLSLPTSTLTGYPGTTEIPSFEPHLAKASSDTTSQVDERPIKDISLRTKRMKKLVTLLETIRTSPIINTQEHNEKVERLYNRRNLNPYYGHTMSLTCFAAVLEKFCDSSSTISFVYGLLSWEIFRQEEERLAREENLSAIAASKAANKQMVETLTYRRAKTHDWASDGRKAAKMVFDTLKHRNTIDRSFAVLLLAANVSLDGMMKIAHFPATREKFAVAFGQIVESMAEQWNHLARSGYETFDYEQFLESHGASTNP
ncbi:hypothetical protein AOQ84DRAFT_359334 [Glonium stellatum]|uniref:Uncharacterized protein n=1 Tax=Glonium stellatum TaxID=574774 RepID=A0A8E2FC87_9PEZI|nr:hypothetical protein AOQ84DRAFT_359334 [Glonium stellatum]